MAVITTETANKNELAMASISPGPIESESVSALERTRKTPSRTKALPAASTLVSLSERNSAESSTMNRTSDDPPPSIASLLAPIRPTASNHMKTPRPMKVHVASMNTHPLLPRPMTTVRVADGIEVMSMSPPTIEGTTATTYELMWNVFKAASTPTDSTATTSAEKSTIAM